MRLEGLRHEMYRGVRPRATKHHPGGRCGTLYEVGAKFELRCCGNCDDECGGHLALAGHEPQGEYMFD